MVIGKLMYLQDLGLDLVCPLVELRGGGRGYLAATARSSHRGPLGLCTHWRGLALKTGENKGNDCRMHVMPVMVSHVLCD
jgi:hypothetical protein